MRYEGELPILGIHIEEGVMSHHGLRKGIKEMGGFVDMRRWVGSDKIFLR